MRNGLTKPFLAGALLAALAACDGSDGGSPAEGARPVAEAGPAGRDGGEARKPPYDRATHSGVLAGVVRFGGATLPEKVVLNVSSDEVCSGAWEGEEPLDEMFAVNDDLTVPNVFVYATKGPHTDYGGYVPPTGFVVDQTDCSYVPHVFGVLVGQEFSVANADPTCHNVNVSPRRNEASNTYQQPGQKDTYVFTKKEKAIPFACDVHSWMSAKAWVMDHPFFATSDADGNFLISGLPDGEYVFKAWHENEDFGSAEFEVTIAGDEVTATVTLQ